MIVFINSYNHNKANRFSRFSPAFPPIGIGYLAALAETKNIEFKIFDQQLHKNIETEIIKSLEGNNLNNLIFAFGVVTPAFIAAKKSALFLKSKYPDAIFIIGGIHATALPKEIIELNIFDYLIKGEAEESFFKLYEFIVSKSIDIKDINGLIYKKDQTYLNNEKNQVFHSFEKLPQFPYHLFENESRYDIAVILSSRGCKMNCSFCSHNIISNYNVRFCPTDIVINDIELLINTHKKTHILFLDDNFLENHSRVNQLLDLIVLRGFDKKCSFSFQARCDQINESILQKLYSANFKTVFFGIETISRNLLKSINKRLTPEIIINAIELAKKYGMNVQASFIFGFPHENHNDRVQTLKFALSNKINIAKFNNLVPYPGTPIFNDSRYINNIIFDYDYSNADTLIALTNGILKKRNLPFFQSKSKDKSIIRFIYLSYFLFYFRFSGFNNLLFNSKKSIKWIYLKNSKNKIELSKIMSLLQLVITMSLKFSTIFWYPSKENIFVWFFSKNKE
ncbi:MAG: radical SAM protein [Candidatus Carbobacillus sp.]|nr:radical SAM protein [Candidatus Carbobacillus sp.]